MTDTHDSTNGSDSQRDLTPPEVDHTHLPDQTMHRIDLAEASHFEQGQTGVTTYRLAITNDFTLL